jgi:hypothetical protein
VVNKRLAALASRLDSANPTSQAVNTAVRALLICREQLMNGIDCDPDAPFSPAAAVPDRDSAPPCPADFALCSTPTPIPTTPIATSEGVTWWLNPAMGEVSVGRPADPSPHVAGCADPGRPESGGPTNPPQPGPKSSPPGDSFNSDSEAPGAPVGVGPFEPQASILPVVAAAANPPTVTPLAPADFDPFEPTVAAAVADPPAPPAPVKFGPFEPPASISTVAAAVADPPPAHPSQPACWDGPECGGGTMPAGAGSDGLEATPRPQDDLFHADWPHW